MIGILEGEPNITKLKDTLRMAHEDLLQELINRAVENFTKPLHICGRQ